MALTRTSLAILDREFQNGSHLKKAEKDRLGMRAWTGPLATYRRTMVPGNARGRSLALPRALLLLEMWSHVCRALGNTVFLKQHWPVGL